jgi:hypothetical protein
MVRVNEVTDMYFLSNRNSHIARGHYLNYCKLWTDPTNVPPSFE